GYANHFYRSAHKFEQICRHRLRRQNVGYSNFSQPQSHLSFCRSEERFSRNAETDLVCRLLLEKKKRPSTYMTSVENSRHCKYTNYTINVLHKITKSSLPLLSLNLTATTVIYTLSLHDALPIWIRQSFLSKRA